MKRQLEKELSADLRTLRNVVKDVSKALQARTTDLNSAVEQVNRLTERDLQKFPQDVRNAIAFIKKNATNLQTAMEPGEKIGRASCRERVKMTKDSGR